MPNSFIDRPIFAWVIAIIITLAGGLVILKLSVAQYPTIVPSAATIFVSYPGTDAKTVQDMVTQVIEQNMNGIDNLMYMSFNSDPTGTVQITLTLESGTDAGTTQVQVQNKLQLAIPLLSQEVQQQGANAEKSSSGFLTVVGVINTNGVMMQEDISDYAAANIKDAISHALGVGDVQLFGSQYAMRIWMNPNELNKSQLTPVDITTTTKTQNTQVAVGQLSGTPLVKGQQLSISIIVQTRLIPIEEFGKILLKVNQDGSRVLLHDVAKIELSGENYDTIAEFNGQPASGLGIKLAASANTLDTAAVVRTGLAKIEPSFPSGLRIVYPYGTTPFVKISICEVVKTLVEAIALAFPVVYLFSQSFRTALIPTIAVPAVLLGTFAVLTTFSFSINTLTMFGMVLTIGLLVDDVVIVVENVECVMAEEGLPPEETTRKSIRQIQGALVGITMVPPAVSVPTAFFGGSTGATYCQFSIIVILTMALSILVALILVPTLCATMLKPIIKGDHEEGKKGFFDWSNHMFEKSMHHYTDSIGSTLRSMRRCLVLYPIIVVGMVYLFVRLSSPFLPDENQGVLMTMVQLPAGATQERAQKVLNKVANYYLTKEESNVESTFAANGPGFAGRGQGTDIAFVSSKDWADRPGEKNKVETITTRATHAFSQVRDAMVLAFNLPVIVELGIVTGFDFELINQVGLDHEKLTQTHNQLLAETAKRPDMLTSVRPNGLEDTPQFKIDIDQEKAQMPGVSISDTNTTLGTAWGGSCVNDSIGRGRAKKIYTMSEAKYRMLPGDIGDRYIHAVDGQMVPFLASFSSRQEYGSPRLGCYNDPPSMEISGQAAPGKSAGEVVELME